MPNISELSFHKLYLLIVWEYKLMIFLRLLQHEDKKNKNMKQTRSFAYWYLKFNTILLHIAV